MERKIVLEVEELEERIAPHFTALGQEHAMVGGQAHGPNVALLLPNGNQIPLPAAASHGIHTAFDGPE